MKPSEIFNKSLRNTLSNIEETEELVKCKHKSKRKPQSKSSHKHQYKLVHAIVWRTFGRRKVSFHQRGFRCAICNKIKVDKIYWNIEDIPQEILDAPIVEISK